MQSIYVHLDSISNHVLSSSVRFRPTVLSQNKFSLIYTIPLYIAEDRYHVMENVYIKENLFGQLMYHEENGWSLEIYKRKTGIL